jgi:hypothetical protein
MRLSYLYITVHVTIQGFESGAIQTPSQPCPWISKTTALRCLASDMSTKQVLGTRDLSNGICPLRWLAVLQTAMDGLQIDTRRQVFERPQ